MKLPDRLWAHIVWLCASFAFLGITLGAPLYLGFSEAMLENWEQLSSIVRNYGLLFLAIPALWLAWRRTNTATKQANISERGLMIDRYQKGAQMLESSELSVRMAGIYALHDLAISDPDDMYILVLELLAAFVREKSKLRKEYVSIIPRRFDHKAYGDFPADLQAALNSIFNIRDVVPRAEDIERAAQWRLNLSGANLSNVSLHKANITRTDLSYAKLKNSYLAEVDLENAQLIKTDMRMAFLLRANLTATYLSSAILDNSVFMQTNLSNAGVLGIDFNRLTINGVWAFKDCPPRSMSTKLKNEIIYRDRSEPDCIFFERLERIVNEPLQDDRIP